MNEKNISKEIFILVDDIKSSIDDISSRDNMDVDNIYPHLNLISIKTFQTVLDDIVDENYNIIDKAIIDKIESTILDHMKTEISDIIENISALVDIEPFSEENVKQLDELDGIVIEKTYPFVSSVHVYIQTNVLLEVAQFEFIKKISDSTGDIKPMR